MSKFLTPQKKNRKCNLETIAIPPSPFLEKLGYGTGVNVWKLQGSPKTTGNHSPWAVKNVRSGLSTPYSKKYQDMIKLEAKVLSSLHHENIIDFRGFFKSTDGRQCLVMRKCGESLGTLIEARLEEDGGPYAPEAITKVAYCVAKALDYLHTEKEILHGDIKSYNILIRGDFDVVKLCDFGVCQKLKDGVVNEFVGTPVYSAPECQEGATGPITSKADIFSLGLVMWEMLALTPPHSGLDDSANYDSADESEWELSAAEDSVVELDSSGGEGPSPWGTRPALPAVPLGPPYHAVLEAFHCCTEQDPARRPSAADLAQHLGRTLAQHS